MNFMRLSLMKGARADLVQAACRKFGASPISCEAQWRRFATIVCLPIGTGVHLKLRRPRSASSWVRRRFAYFRWNARRIHDYAVAIFNLYTRCPFSQTRVRKSFGVVFAFNTVSVSRATHLPASLAAPGLPPCEMPAPWPSLQEQSLPKNNLSWWRFRKSAV